MPQPTLDPEQLAAARRAVEEHPESARAHVRLGTLLMQHESARAGEEHFRKALELDARCVPAWVNLGGILLARWDFRGCLEANLRAIELQPDSVGAHYNAGLAQMYLGEPQAMHGCFARVVDLEPNHPAGNYHLAVALLALKRTAEARARLQQAMELGHAPTPEFVRELERIDRQPTSTPAPGGNEQPKS